MVVATVLVIASQALATREVVGLHREVATRRFDERLTELVRRSSDMIAICDTEGVIRYASPSSEQLLGVTAGELNGQRLDDVLGPESAHVREAFEQVLRAAYSEQAAAFSIPQADGEKRSYKMVIANLCHVDSIRGITLNIRDVSDAARLNDQLRTLAFHDPLTLLANRSLFSDRVHQAIRHLGDGMTPAVLFIDLDNFKTVNDSLGHSAGDQLLRGFAHRLVQCTRAGDTVARLGGDEFAVLIDHAAGRGRGLRGGPPGHRGLPQALRNRRPAGAHRRQRGRGDRGPRQQCRKAAAQCRCRDVLGEVQRQGSRAGVRARDAARRAPPHPHRKRAGNRHRAAAVRGSLPAHRRPGFAPPGGCRGVDALATSDAWPGDAG